MDSAFTPIRRLSAETVNRIAAGEVIERPAAAVKELVENALDAGARRISVTIAGGGIDRIEVEDDGRGIPEADLPLAIERHATSKLADETLIRIATLGFRGEALPSIGAAGRLTLISRPPGQDAAAKITVEGGAVGPVGPAPGGFGTRAIVEDLFYATPARRKFLRSARSEAGACADLVRHLALAAPQVGLRLGIDGHVSFDLPPETAETRVGRLLGTQDSTQLIAIEAERDGAVLSGFIGPATLTRAAARHQFFMVNGRPVRDPLLRTAIRVAYREVIPAGRHPVAFLWLDLPEDRLDVNVHPAKAELRFADPAGIRSLVIGALGRALAAPASLDAAPGFGTAAPGRASAGSMPASRESMQSLSWTRPSAPRRGFAEAEARFGFDLADSLSIRPGPDGALSVNDRSTPAGPADGSGAAPDAEADIPTLGMPIAQIFDTYILARAEDGALILVDQHAAHERLTEERLREERDRGGIARQALLSPVPVDLPEDDVARLLDEADALGRLGLEIEQFGPGAVLVRALPAAIARADPGDLLRDVADTLAETGTTTALEARLDAVLARLACHRSIRAGRRLAGPEMMALLRDMAATPRAQTCPHGRPTVIRLGRDDIDLLFGRR